MITIWKGAVVELKCRKRYNGHRNNEKSGPAEFCRA